MKYKLLKLKQPIQVGGQYVSFCDGTNYSAQDAKDPRFVSIFVTNRSILVPVSDVMYAEPEEEAPQVPQEASVKLERTLKK